MKQGAARPGPLNSHRLVLSIGMCFPEVCVRQNAAGGNMMYLLIVALTMFILPVGSIWIDARHTANPELIWLIGKWFVFWGVGVRLLLAGLRQYMQPAFTSREILGLESPDVFVLVRELGGANIAAGIVGLISLALPSFVIPSAVASGIFYGFAAAEHAKSKHRNTNEIIALVSDVFIAVVLLGFAIAAIARGLN